MLAHFSEVPCLPESFSRLPSLPTVELGPTYIPRPSPEHLNDEDDEDVREAVCRWDCWGLCRWDCWSLCRWSGWHLDELSLGPLESLEDSGGEGRPGLSLLMGQEKKFLSIRFNTFFFLPSLYQQKGQKLFLKNKKKFTF